MESWPTSSIESWESSLFLRLHGVHGAFLELLCCNCCFFRLETCVSGNLGSCLKEVNPLVMCDGEWSIAVKPMQGNGSSFRVDLGYTELFHIPAVVSVSF